ncbi:MAG: homocysteine S-methyltransferase [Anaerolineales bacterium]|nr:MAG: homocysteine S-methyltransferase [Anaerolineales bacterium]
MNFIASILDHQPALVIDGALATELERRGYDLKDELWSAKILLEKPEAIRQLHYDYFKAGADCVITASYQATIAGFMKRGLTETESVDLLKKSVRLAIEARDEFWNNEANRSGRMKPFVAASVGPYGAYLADGSEYRGNYGLSEEQLMDFHRPRMKALIEAGADILACETIPTPIEARALVKLLGEFQSVHAWISFSCRDEAHVNEGDKLEDCIRQVEASPYVDAVGINCTSPRFIPSLIREAKKATTKPILVYPNSGETYDATKSDWDGHPVYGSFSEEAKVWYEAGARLIGGCCRTTPEDIHGIAGWARSSS